jgi:pimeloyl-ACP methyl ester carboxylesterase
MSQPTIVFVHGIWMPGSEMLFLKQQLAREHGYEGRLFSYPSVSGTLDDNAKKLADFITAEGFDKVHVVAHSLGGVVTLRMAATITGIPLARVVCLGSPLCGSRAAQSLSDKNWAQKIMGNSLSAGVVDECVSGWAGDVTDHYEIGVIAGTRSIGLGKLFASFDGENDGTVAVAETRLAGIRDHVCLPVSHTGLVLSKDVVSQTSAFLSHGEFLRDYI